MLTLVEFLRARLDEDEQVAKAATIGPWRVVNVTDYGTATVDGPDALQDGGYDDATKTRRQTMRPLTVVPPDVDHGPTVDRADAEHIARHDPARVQADVAAMRQLLDLHPHTTWRQSVGEQWLRSNYGPHWEKRLKDVVDSTYCANCDVDDGVIEGDGRPCLTLRLLAQRYADHPDYREEWRP